MKTPLLFFISCCCTIAIYQSELEEIRDDSYGISGAVDLFAKGFEDCDLIAIDGLNNQYIIDYDSPTIRIIKLQENGEQVMDYGINGSVTIDDVFVQRLMVVKAYEDKLYLLADDQDTVFLYAFTADGQADPSFGEGERIIATNVPANYHYFYMDVIDDEILVGAGHLPFPYTALFVEIDQFSLEGASLTTDTITLVNHPYADVIDIQFKPSGEIYLVYFEQDPFDSLYFNVRRYQAITALDSSFATNGTYTIPHENFSNFNLVVQDDQLTISYLLDTFFIKHERLNLAGDVIYEHTAPKIETLHPYFLFLERLGMHLTDDGYFVMERVFHENWSTDYYLTKYDSNLLLDTTFGQAGSYAIEKIPRWRAVDEQGRIYMTLRTANYLKLIRTGVNEVTSLEEMENKKNYFSIYPNPTNSIVHISSESKPKGDVLCQIFDLNSQLLSSQYYRQTSFDLDLSTYAPGGYVVQLVSAGRSTSYIVLKH